MWKKKIIMHEFPQIQAYNEEADISEDEPKKWYFYDDLNPDRVSVEGIEAPANPYVELIASHNSTSCQEDAWTSCRKDVRSKAPHHFHREHLHSNQQSMHGTLSCDIYKILWLNIQQIHYIVCLSVRAPLG